MEFIHTYVLRRKRVKSANIPNDTTGLPISLQSIIPPSYTLVRRQTIGDYGIHEGAIKGLRISKLHRPRCGLTSNLCRF